jgi:hypothetical protein
MKSPESQAAPFQDDPRAPHWVVVSMSRDADEAAVRGKRRWRHLFRHPTEELANAECARLATISPGTRFTVYASGFTCKVEPIPIVPPAPVAGLSEPVS